MSISGKQPKENFDVFPAAGDAPEPAVAERFRIVLYPAISFRIISAEIAKPAEPQLHRKIASDLTAGLEL
jgi:hypothetical protein